jgi:hypothetical protein
MSMPRAALLLAIGIGLGAAIAVYFEAPRTSVSDRSAGDTSPAVSTVEPRKRPVEPEANVVDALAARPRGTAERAAFYATVARSDARGIETLLIAARALSDREAHAFALDVLLGRYAELDPSEAVAAAKELGVPAASLAPLYHAWVKVSASAALASLGALDTPKRMEVASGVLALASDDDGLVARIVALLPPEMSRGIYASALGQLARTSPTEALARAKKVTDSGERRDAVNRVLSAWVQADPRAVADYLAGLEPDERHDANQAGVWYQIAQAAPELALDRVDSLSQDVRTAVQSIALQALAQRDPQAALARIAQMPPGVVSRDGMLATIARSYAARDAEGALAWARSLQPPQQGVMAAVVSGIADKDPARAFDLAMELTSPLERTQALQQVASMAIVRDPASTVTLLERALAMPNGQERQMLVQTIVSNWSARDPAKAAEWLLANPGQPPDIVTQAAMGYARTDPARAASYATRLTGDTRVAWLRGVAMGYAQVDSRAALEWVDQLRGTPEYDEAALAVLQSAQQPDFASAARLLESIGRDDYRRNAVGSLASRWANVDPPAAASWASNQRDPMLHQMAVQMVASMWAQQDAPAAREWVLSQPPGEARDSALIPLISAAARFGTPDASLLGQLSTDQARLGAVQNAAIAMAQRDPDGARAFVETNVTDPEQRQRVMSVVSQVTTRRFGPIGGPVIGAFPTGMPPAGLMSPATRTGTAAGAVVGFSQSQGPSAASPSANTPAVRAREPR